VFTADQEAQLAQEIRDECLLEGHIFTDTDLRFVAIKADSRWNPLNPKDEVPSSKQSIDSQVSSRKGTPSAQPVFSRDEEIAIPPPLMS
jgi:hypothetical protein